MEEKLSKQDVLALQASCACLQARGKARFLTQEYDRILEPSGLRITQFNILSLLLAEPFTMSELAAAANIDRTTLTRGLNPLERDGYIITQDNQDARKRVIRLTAKGEKATQQALQLWNRAQAQYAVSVA